MDSLTEKLGVLPGKQQNDSFGLGENGWCDKPRILKYMYSCGSQDHGSKDSLGRNLIHDRGTCTCTRHLHTNLTLIQPASELLELLGPVANK